MGKGDQRTKRGKIWRGSHGKTRRNKDKAQPSKPQPKPQPRPQAQGTTE